MLLPMPIKDFDMNYCNIFHKYCEKSHESSRKTVYIWLNHCHDFPFQDGARSHLAAMFYIRQIDLPWFQLYIIIMTLCFRMAPEVIMCETLKDNPYNFKADIWSLGLIYYIYFYHVKFFEIKFIKISYFTERIQNLCEMQIT